MSRTRRNVQYHDMITRERVLNNEEVFPIFYSKRNNVDYRLTSWDEFFSCSYINGYDGKVYKPYGKPSSRYECGYIYNWWWSLSRKNKRFFKQKTSKCRRFYAKNEIREILREI